MCVRVCLFHFLSYIVTCSVCLSHFLFVFLIFLQFLFSVLFVHRHPWSFIAVKGNPSSAVEDHALYQGRNHFPTYAVHSAYSGLVFPEKKMLLPVHVIMSDMIKNVQRQKTLQMTIVCILTRLTHVLCVC